MDRRKRGVVGPKRSKLTPVRKATPAERRKTSASIPTMDRSSMLVIEANEIVQCLNKQYVFQMKDVGVIDEATALVRVRNTQTKLECVWPLLKLKERLVRMRKLMYADEAESQGIGGDSVFFDAADKWIPEGEESVPVKVPATPDDKDNAIPNTPQRSNQSSDVANSQLKNKESADRSRNSLANGHNAHAQQTSNHNSQKSNHNHLGIETLSNETALPSVSVSIGFQSTQETIKLPNGFPDQKNSNPTIQSLSSTASSELPADSEFLGMSLASTISSSPLSPPPPPQSKEFAQSSNTTVERRNGHRKRNVVATDNSALPEKYLTSPKANQLLINNETAGYAVTKNPVRRSPPTVAPHYSQGQMHSQGQMSDKGQMHGQGQPPGQSPSRDKGQMLSQPHGNGQLHGQSPSRDKGQSHGQVQGQLQGQSQLRGQGHIQSQHESSFKPIAPDPGSQANHRPIIKNRSLNEQQTPQNALKNSPLKKSRETSSNVNKDVQNIPQPLDSIPVAAAVVTKEKHITVKQEKQNIQPKPVSNTDNHSNSGSTRSVSTTSGRDVDSGLSSSKNFPSSRNGSEVTEKSAVCQHCKGMSPTSRDARLQRKNKRMISSLRICRDMVKTLAYRCKGAVRSDTIPDRIMYNCESIKIAVINILEAYTQAQESRNDMTVFADSELVKLTSIQLVSALELLVSHTSLWSTSLVDSDAELIKDACNKMTNMVKAGGFFHQYFLRCQGLVECMTSLVDSVSLLCQASEPLIDEEDPGILKKIARCADMIFKLSNKLVLTSNFNLSNSSVLDTSFSVSSASVMSLDMRSDDLILSDVIADKQCEEIDHCGEDVKLATQALCSVIRKRLPSNDTLTPTGSKVKRMLPATPGVAAARPSMQRCKSAKNPERMRRSISSYDVNGTKKSSEI